MSRVIGVDYGARRIGLAISDGLGITARPLEVVEPGRFRDRMAELIAEYGVSTVVIGLPSPLGGGESASTVGARALAGELDGLGVEEVVFVDERFTSKMAESALLESGMKRRDRRATVDKVAAAIILQTYLDGNFPPEPDVLDHR